MSWNHARSATIDEQCVFPKLEKVENPACQAIICRISETPNPDCPADRLGVFSASGKYNGNGRHAI